MMDARNAIPCEHCGRPLGVVRSDGSVRVTVASRAIFLKAGAVETNCPHCQQSTRLPLSPSL